MICPVCEKEIADGSTFCDKCGARFAPPKPKDAAPKQEAAAPGQSYEKSLEILDKSFLQGKISSEEYMMLKEELNERFKKAGASPVQEVEEGADYDDFSWESSDSAEVDETLTDGEMVECPICGKTIGKDSGFWCKKCNRDYICFEHRHPRTGHCSECMAPPKPKEVVHEPPPEPEKPKVNPALLKEFKIMRGHVAGINSMHVCKDGKQLVTSSNDTTMKIWNIRSGKVAQSHPGIDVPFNSVKFAPDKKFVLAGGRDSKVYVWELFTGKIFKIGTHDNEVTAVAISPDGAFAFSSSVDGKVCQWEITPYEKPPHVFQEGNGPVNDMALSPDGQRLIAGGDDNIVRVYSVETGKLEAELSGHDKEILSVAFSSDGESAVTGGKDKALKLWEVSSGELAGGFETVGFVTAAAISPDKRYLLSGEGAVGEETGRSGSEFEVTLWDLETGEDVRNYVGHEDSITSVMFLPYSKFVASASADNTIRTWRVPE